jgi:hypothetical protein
MKKIKLGRIILYLIVIVLSTLNYESDFAKFLFSGYSSTYDVIMIRHSPYLVISLAAIAIFLSIAGKIRNVFWLKYAIPVAFGLWILSMRTAAYVETDSTLVSGWSFIRIASSKCSTEKGSADTQEVESCDIDFDLFLDSKLKDKLRMR